MVVALQDVMGASTVAMIKDSYYYYPPGTERSRRASTEAQDSAALHNGDTTEGPLWCVSRRNGLPEVVVEFTVYSPFFCTEILLFPGSGGHQDFGDVPRRLFAPAVCSWWTDDSWLTTEKLSFPTDDPYRVPVMRRISRSFGIIISGGGHATPAGSPTRFMGLSEVQTRGIP